MKLSSFRILPTRTRNCLLDILSNKLKWRGEDFFWENENNEMPLNLFNNFSYNDLKKTNNVGIKTISEILSLFKNENITLIDMPDDNDPLEQEKILNIINFLQKKGYTVTKNIKKYHV